MLRRRFLMGAIAAVVAALIAPSTGQSSFKLTFESGANSHEFDLLALTSGVGGSGPGYSYDLFTRTVAGDNTTANFVTLNIFGYSIAFNTSFTNTPNGDPGQLKMSNVTIVRNSTSLSNDLSISLTGTGYVKPDPDRYMSTTFSGQWDNNTATGSKAVFTSIYDVTNAEYGVGNTASHSDYAEALVGANKALSNAEVITNLPLGSPTYSLTLKMEFTNFSVGSTNSFTGGNADVTINPVPVPSGLVLLGTAVPFVGLLRRRLRRTTETPVSA